MYRIFIPGDILLPVNVNMSLWSVIACDQFTSQPEYWDELSERVGEAPSTLRLMLPEAYLDSCDEEIETKKINAAMENYLNDGVFQTLESSFIYLERDMTVGEKRRGILGLLDLEAYDYTPQAKTPVRCTEGTVENRLPPRVKVRKDAAIEMPHVIVLTDDPDWLMFEGLEKGEMVYDFELNDGGGRIIGKRIAGELAEGIEQALQNLSTPEHLEKKYGLTDCEPVIIAMGDGNHSIATAKLCWERMKPQLTPEERANHPARYGLVELVNIHDPSIKFEPIHRVLFETDAATFLKAAATFFASAYEGGKGCHEISILCSDASKKLSIKGKTIGQAIALAQSFCENYVSQHGGHLDYIHDDDTAMEMSAAEGCCGILFPAIEKDELFTSIIRSGAFPAKSFSIGPARDKRYYLECRKIK